MYKSVAAGLVTHVTAGPHLNMSTMLGQPRFLQPGKTSKACGYHCYTETTTMMVKCGFEVTDEAKSLFKVIL